MVVEFLIFLITSLMFYFAYNHFKILAYFKCKGVKCKLGVPLFGNTLQSSFQKRHIVYDMEDVYHSFPKERYVGYIEGTAPTFLMRDPELFKRITVKDFDHFSDHRAFSFDPLFDNSLFLMKGDKWRDMRTTLSPAFTGSKIRGMVPFISEISHNFVQYLKETEGQEIDLGDVVRRYTNDVIASVAFGLQVNSLKEPNNDFYKTGQSLMVFTAAQKMKMFLKSQFKFIDKILKLGPVFSPEKTKFFRDIIKKTMNYRDINQVERADMIQILMEASKGTLKNAFKEDDDSVGFATTEEHSVKTADKVRKWTEDELIAQAFIFFFAGFESSATVLVLALHELVLNQEAQEKLYQEVKKYNEVNQTLTYDHVPDLQYLDCVVNETLRKWSAAFALDRLCIKPYKLPPPHIGRNPVMLNPGDVVFFPINAIQMDKQYYPEPKKFIPERFSDENKDKINPFTFLPFGSGPRNCIGSRFALLEIKVLLYNIILHFEVLRCKKTADPIRLHPADFNIRVDGGSWAKIRTRN